MNIIVILDEHHLYWIQTICRPNTRNMWIRSLILCFIWLVVKSEITNSLRELAGGAFLKAWPIGNKNLIGKHVDKTFQYVTKLDAEDCGKKLLCGLAGKKTKLSWDEELLLEAFKGSIDYTSSYVQLRVAVEVGRRNVTNCKMVYSRCSLQLEEMSKLLRRQGISFEIPGEEKDCSVYFLWKTKGRIPRKKEQRIAKTVPQITAKPELSTKSVPQIIDKSELSTEIETENTTIKPENIA